MKDIDQLIPDIQMDADKIAKAFNSTMAKEFYNVLEEESKDWYYQNKSKGIYKRTKQLRDKAILKEKENNYEYKISFSRVISRTLKTTTIFRVLKRQENREMNIENIYS